MFLLGFILLLTISYGEIFNFRKIGKNLDIKNFLTAIFVGSGFLITLCIILIQHALENNDLSILKDWRLYVGIIMEIFGVWISRKNYELNHSSITAINFSLFLSIILVPIFSFTLTDFFNFSAGINLKISINELIFFLIIYSILLVIYFIDKIKGHINNKLVLFIMPISLSCSMFWTTKMMQIYQGVVYYGIIGFCLLVFFLSAAIIHGEIKNLRKFHIKKILIVASISSVVLPLNIVAIKVLAVEFVSIFKRMSQLKVALWLERKENLPSKKDIVVIIGLLLTTVSMFIITMF